MTQGSTSVEIDRNPAVVFSAVADVTRMGEWSPECIAARWVGDATGPAVGAKFEGDNRFTMVGLTLKKWTTTSEVTACVPGEVFEFVAEGYTTWRYRLEPSGAGTKLTESYEYTTSRGAQRFLYDVVMRRPAEMVKGMQHTLERIKQSLESQ
jgi:Polyketide cyclase / dehydrase and lipid transport